jgi:hypothetical protein
MIGARHDPDGVLPILILARLLVPEVLKKQSFNKRFTPVVLQPSSRLELDTA